MHGRTPDRTRNTDAKTAHDELAAALRAAGIALPSLTLDVPPHPALVDITLIDLGRCNARTARQLAHALRAHAGARENAR